MKKAYVLAASLLCTLNLVAQNVGIGTSTPNASSKLEISSTNSGVLIPRMDKSQRIAITSPAQGLLVFQNAPDSIGFYYFSSTWVWLQNASGAGSGWSVTGNTGTDTSVNFIGTKDNMPIRFKVNNTSAGLISANNIFLGNAAGGSFDYGGSNLALGDSAAANNISGFSNIAIGTKALAYNTTKNNLVAIGDSALYKNGTGATAFEAIENVAIGSKTLLANTKGSFNIAVGNGALNKNTTGSGNTSVGTATLYNNNGTFNTAMGNNSMYNNTTGSSNTAYGAFSLANCFTGDNNTAVGTGSLVSNTSGFSNVAIGINALRLNTTKSNLVAVGDSALYNINGGLANTAIGSKALFTNFNGYNNTAVGYEALKFATHGGNTAFGSGALYNNSSGENNVAIGFSAYRSGTGNNNIAIGESAGYQIGGGNNNTILGSDTRVSGTFRTISGSIFLGFQAGGVETTSNKLYIENSIADKDNALIYGDFANDSINLNAKINVKDFTRLGTQASGAPAIKMKKLLIPAGPAVDGVQSYAIGGGITDDKVIGVQIFVTYASPWKIPASYRDAAGYEFNYQVQGNNIVIINKAGNSANIGAKPFTVLITYEE